MLFILGMQGALSLPRLARHWCIASRRTGSRYRWLLGEAREKEATVAGERVKREVGGGKGVLGVRREDDVGIDEGTEGSWAYNTQVGV